MNGLIKIGEIQAVDSADFLDQFSANLDVLAEKNKLKTKQLWAEQKAADIKTAYRNKAREALKKQWDLCGSTTHNYRNLDIKGTTILVCSDCSHGSGSHEDYVGYNEASVNNLAKRLIALDIEAGVLSWPTVDDYKAPIIPKTKVPPVLARFRKKKSAIDPIKAL